MDTSHEFQTTNTCEYSDFLVAARAVGVLHHPGRLRGSFKMFWKMTFNVFLNTSIRVWVKDGVEHPRESNLREERDWKKRLESLKKLWNQVRQVCKTAIEKNTLARGRSTEARSSFFPSSSAPAFWSFASTLLHCSSCSEDVPALEVRSTTEDIRAHFAVNYRLWAAEWE